MYLVKSGVRFLVKGFRRPAKYLEWTKTTLSIVRRYGFLGWLKFVKFRLSLESPTEGYSEWVSLFGSLSSRDRELIRERIQNLQYRPKFSIVMPVFNIDESWLRKAIESVIKQLYPDWELCIADDNSTRPHVKKVIREYQAIDPRIKSVFRTVNGHISLASNSALDLADGEFVAMLDHDDELAEHALYLVAEELNQNPSLDLIYSDEDKIDQNGKRYDPHFKPGWNPDLFYSCNYISHLSVFRKSGVTSIGGFRVGYEGSQDYDLALRFIERTEPNRISHIPHILYHWRSVEGSAALSSDQKAYAPQAARRAILEHFKRTSTDVTVVPVPRGKFHRVRYAGCEPTPTVSVIIPTRNQAQLLMQVAQGVLRKTQYPSVEMLIIDNQSSESETLRVLNELESDSRVQILRYDAPFNYSAINNFAVTKSTGKLVCFLNNDIKVIEPNWLKEMVSHALRPEIGAVGAKLLYGDDRIQHAGVVLGLGGIAGHAFKFASRFSDGYRSRAMLLQNYSAVTAACMVLKRNVFDEVGGFDEMNLPVAFNDVDLCLRVLDRGYRNLWTPYAELYHLESVSRGSDELPQNRDRFRKECEYMRNRWGHRLAADPAYNPNLTLSSEDFSLAADPRCKYPWSKTNGKCH